MNKGIVFLMGALGLALASPAAAEVDWQETCRIGSDTAENMMLERQSGVSMADQMEGVEGNVVGERWVIEAYNRPRYHTKEHQRRAIEEFRDWAYKDCISKIGPGGSLRED
ncbi:hypothetical protein [Arhodomonas sp. AD133]|uniref:hypothetical protein n=1 Tax=Arhodomonas sp. AD133 TaxID=3415009 RepID=UPI003EBD02E6